MKNRIALIIPYFGEWPFWIDLYMHSCKFNKEVDFFFYTDCGIPQIADGVANLHFISIRFADYCKKVSDKLGIVFSPENPYKLCDLKPFYGYIHEDLLEEDRFGFWGFGDVDLIWGDIKAFCKDDILDHHDVFSTHADRVSGHFAVFRNNDYYRKLAFSISNWKAKLESNKSFALDEIDLSRLLYGEKIKLLWKMHNKFFMGLPFGDEWAMHCRFVELANKLFCPKQLFFVEQNTTPWPGEISRNNVDFKYENGHVYNVLKGQEIMYLHFLCLKKRWTKDNFFLEKGCDRVRITVEGIY